MFRGQNSGFGLVEISGAAQHVRPFVSSPTYMPGIQNPNFDIPLMPVMFVYVCRPDSLTRYVRMGNLRCLYPSPSIDGTHEHANGSFAPLPRCTSLFLLSKISQSPNS